MSYQEGEEQERKLFVGGLNKVNTDEDHLKQYFEQYGNIIDCNIMRDHEKQSRGFGFILFDDAATIDTIMAAKKEGTNFEVNGQNIEIKRALPMVPGRGGSTRGGGGGGANLYKKLFVGGLPSIVTEDDLRNYFEKYGRVNEIQLLRDRETNKLRGFGFITFEEEDSADKCVQRRSHEICQKICEVKRAKTRSNIEKDDGILAPAPGNQQNSNSNSGSLGINEVNQLIQQAFQMGQQSRPPPASIPNGSGAGTHPTSNVLLQALMGQHVPATVVPVAPAPAPVDAPAAAAGLAGLAQLLQGGGIDPNALVALLKGESGAALSPAAPPPPSTNSGGYYSTSYPPAQDPYRKTNANNYGPTKDDDIKRSYRPY